MNFTFKEAAALGLTLVTLGAIIGLKVAGQDVPTEVSAIPGVGVGYLFGTQSNPKAT